MDRREYSKDVYNITLDNRRGKTRHQCPKCLQKRCLTRYIYANTGEDVGEQYGRCDHVRKCGYDNRPTAGDLRRDAPIVISSRELHKSLADSYNNDAVDCIPAREVLSSIQGVESDSMFKFLCTLYDRSEVQQIFLKYYIGAGAAWHKKWKGIIYWQIDKDLCVRTGKMMGYKIVEQDKIAVDIKRVKDPYPQFEWKHNDYTDFNLRQCLFGEHLVRELKPGSVVNVVESEKTALICSLNSPKSIFVATGGLDLLNSNKLIPFKNMKLVFHPDKGEAYDRWKSKIEKECQDFNVEISDYMQRHKTAPDGSDVGDVAIRKKVKEIHGIELF